MLRIVAAALLVPCLAAAEAPAKIGYQGRLLKADGSPEAGSHTLGFAVFAANQGGTALWSESQTLALSDGYYATFLGEQTAIDASVFGGGERWLELTVDGAALSPRQKIGSVPYALTCNSVSGGAVNASSVLVNGTQVISSSGQLTGAAAYSAAAGSGLSLNGTALSLSSCPTGQVLQATANGWACAGVGTVTSVSASAPLSVATGSSTPALSIAKADGSTDGYLSSADWTTFNSKAPASGSPNYLQNQTASPQTASFNITGSGTFGGDLHAGGNIFIGPNNLMNMFPFYRISSNQILTGTTGGTSANNDTVNGWSANAACGVYLRYMFTVNTNVLWANRTPEEQALLTAMGRAGTQYIERAFNVYRLGWNNGPCSWTFFQHAPDQPSMTTAAFTKLEAGTIVGFWANGISTSWALTGTHLGPNINGYSHPHPATSTATGSLLIAMPATVVGYVDLTNPVNWGWFPYVNPDTSL